MGGSPGDSGEEPVSPVSDDGGVMEAIDASMAAVLLLLVGVEVMGVVIETIDASMAAVLLVVGVDVMGDVIETIDASMAAVLLVGVTGVGVRLPPLPLPPDPFINPARDDGLGLPMPLLGGLIRFSFWRLNSNKTINSISV